MTLTEYLQLYFDNRRTLSGFRILAGKTSEMLGPSGWNAVGDNVFTAAMIVKLARRLVNGKELTAGVPMPFRWNQSNWSLTFGADPPALEIKLLDTNLDESPLTTTPNLPDQILDKSQEAGSSRTAKSPRIRTRVAKLGLVKRPSKTAEPSIPVAEVVPQAEPVTSELADRTKPKSEKSRKPDGRAQREVAAEPEVAPLDTTVVAPDNQAGPEDDLAPIAVEERAAQPSAPLQQSEFFADPEVTSDAPEVLLEGGAAPTLEPEVRPEPAMATEETIAEPSFEICAPPEIPSTTDAPPEPTGDRSDQMEPSVELVSFEVEHDERSQPEVARHAKPEVGSQPVPLPDTVDVSADLDSLIQGSIEETSPLDPAEPEPEPEAGAEPVTGPDSQVLVPADEMDMESYLRLVLSGGPDALAAPHRAESAGAREAEANHRPEHEVRAEPLACADARESDVVTAVEMNLDSFLEVLLSGGPEVPATGLELITEAQAATPAAAGPEAEPLTGVDPQESAAVAAPEMALQLHPQPALSVELEVELDLREPQPELSTGAQAAPPAAPGSSESSADAAPEAVLEVRAEPLPTEEMAPDEQSKPAGKPEPGPAPSEGDAQEPSIARLAPSLLKGRPGRKLSFAPGDFPVLFLDNFPISVGSTVSQPEQMDDLLATIPLRLESAHPTFSHWQQNEQALWADSPFYPDCQHRLEGSEEELELLAERPGESVVRQNGVLRYLGDSAAPVELCKNEERGARAPQVLMRDRAVWMLAWGSKPKKRWLPRLGGAHEFHLIRYAPCGDSWSGSRFATFEKAPIWSVSTHGEMCGWMSSTRSEWKLEIVDCQEETVLGEFTLTAGQGKPSKLLVSDDGNFVIQLDRMAVVGEKAEQGYQISQFPLEVEMELESIGPFGLLCRRDRCFQLFPLQRNSWPCEALTLTRLEELARTYPLVYVPQVGPALAYQGRWLVLPFDCPEVTSWQALVAELRQTHQLQQPFEVVDLEGEKRFVHVLKEHLQVSQFRVLPSNGEWTIVRADGVPLPSEIGANTQGQPTDISGVAAGE